MLVMSRSVSPAASVPDEASRALVSLVATASRGATIGYAANSDSFCAAGERHKGAHAIRPGHARAFPCDRLAMSMSMAQMPRGAP